MKLTLILNFFPFRKRGSKPTEFTAGWFSGYKRVEVATLRRPGESYKDFTRRHAERVREKKLDYPEI